MTPAHRLFKRALDEKLEYWRKHAFQPAPPEGQASGPGGMPVDPAAGGAPMDPMAMGGGAPMDPSMGGAPMDPMAMGGAPPMDPAAMGGAPPMDPMAMGDPMAGGDPLAGGLPPPPAPEGEDPLAGGAEGVTEGDAQTVQDVQQNTLNLVRQTLEMVGKAKPKEEQAAETEAAVNQIQSEDQGTQAAGEAAPPTQPGPVTGQPVPADTSLPVGPGSEAPKTASVIKFSQTAGSVSNARAKLARVLRKRKE